MYNIHIMYLYWVYMHYICLLFLYKKNLFLKEKLNNELIDTCTI